MNLIKLLCGFVLFLMLHLARQYKNPAKSLTFKYVGNLKVDMDSVIIKLKQVIIERYVLISTVKISNHMPLIIYVSLRDYGFSNLGD